MAPLEVRKFYADKTLLLTGASGFVGKVLLWTALTHLKLQQIYIVLRDKRDKSGNVKCAAADRLNEIWQCRIFNSVPDSKRALVTVCAGDIETDGMGLSTADHELLSSRVEVIIHAAASVRFQASLKDNLNTNTLGSLRVLNLAKSCKKLIAMVHVSTAYVNSDLGSGLVVEEKAFPPLSNSEEMLNLLLRATADPSPSADTVEVLRRLQGSHFNTYTFTKQLAEDLLLERREDLPLGIVRPTIVGSAWRQPQHGWVDSPLAAGALFAAGATGLIKYCPGRPNIVGDQIPVDFVCNCALVMGAAVGLDLAESVYKTRGPVAPGRSAWPVDQPCKAERQNILVTQVSSSTTNPITWKYTIDIVQAFFQANPVTKTANCPSPRFSFIESSLLFRLVFLITTLIPAILLSRVLDLVTLVSSKYVAYVNQAKRNVKMAHLGLNIAFAFAPFTSLEWFFDNRHTLALHELLSPAEKQIFYLDSRQIDWREWLIGYCSGLRTEVLKEPPAADPSFTGRGNESIEATQRIEEAKPAELINKSIKELERSQKVVIMACRVSSHKLPAHQPLDADPFLNWTRTNFSPYVIVPTALAAHAALRALFHSLTIDRDSAALLTALSMRLPIPPHECSPEALDKLVCRNPVLLMPTHKSYFDFLVLSYLCLAFELRLPMVAADKVFASLPLISSLLRATGAFFLQRGGQNSEEQSQILKIYFQEALLYHSWVQFFIEGSRSRTGYILRPKRGLLGYAMELLKAERADSLYIVPIGVNYAELMEMSSLSNELLGHAKVGESVSRVLKAFVSLAGDRLSHRRSPWNLLGTSSSEPLRSSRISVKAGKPIRVTADDLGDEEMISWKIIFGLQDVRQLSPNDVCAWAVLKKENLTTSDIVVTILEIVRYLKSVYKHDERSQVFGLCPEKLEAQVDSHMTCQGAFRALFEQTAHVLPTLESDETTFVEGMSSVDTIPDSIEDLPSEKLTQKVWAVRWGVSVPQLNLAMNQLQFFRNAALDLVGVDAFLAEVILTYRQERHPAQIVKLTQHLATYFGETALGRRLKLTSEAELLQRSVRLQNTPPATLTLLSSLLKPWLHGLKLTLETIKALLEPQSVPGSTQGEASSDDLLVETRPAKVHRDSIKVNDFIKECRQFASASPCALGCYPLVDQEMVRSAWVKLLGQVDFPRELPLQADLSGPVDAAIEDLRPHID